MKVHTELADFKSEIESTDKLVVVDFFANWCGPCRMIAPAFAEFVNTYPDVVFVKVDVDEASDIAEKYEINCMPTFLFFKNGQKVGSLSGANKEKLEEQIQKLK